MTIIFIAILIKWKYLDPRVKAVDVCALQELYIFDILQCNTSLWPFCNFLNLIYF